MYLKKKNLDKAPIGHKLLQPPHAGKHMITTFDIYRHQICTSHLARLKLSKPYKSKSICSTVDITAPEMYNVQFVKSH